MSALPAAAQPQIRDAEIENIIRAYAAPLLNAANLDPDAFNTHLINSDDLNAFVARGQRLFITTGLLRRSANANQVLGVMAHEMGHIAGGHLARLHDAMSTAGKTALITQLLGVAVGALSGQPGAGVMIGGGGGAVARRSLLNFSRSQEQAADQAAVTYLDSARLSTKGILEFLTILEQQEFLQSERQDAYLRTHPLTRSRIAFVRGHVERSPYSNNRAPEKFEQLHRRMVAKLDGFLAPPGNTLAKYKADDGSVPARYARAIAYYRQAELNEALPLIASLIADEPANPYFRELRGQVLFENGRLAEAMPSYEEAIRLLPETPLLLTSLAHLQIELNRPELLPRAIDNVKRALQVDPFYPLAWRLAATAYGRRGEMGLSAWSLAEYNLLVGRERDARALAEKAARLLKRGSPSWLRAQDIISGTKKPL
ncbi:MAG: M48 family metalloprotease [Alphaproteobacteria bacterium]